MNLPPEAAQNALTDIYKIVLKDKARRKAIKRVLFHALQILLQKKKITETKLISYRTILSFILSDPTIRPSALSIDTVISIAKKVWPYKHIITSRLVPRMEDIDKIKEADADWVEENSVILTMAKGLFSGLQKGELERLFECMLVILRFCEPHAKNERWEDTKEDKVLRLVQDWVPITKLSRDDQ